MGSLRLCGALTPQEISKFTLWGNGRCGACSLASSETRRGTQECVRAHARAHIQILRTDEMKLSMIVLTASMAYGAVGNLQVRGVTSTQAILAYRAPDTNPCSVR